MNNYSRHGYIGGIMELFQEKKDANAYQGIIHGQVVPMSKARITRLIVSLFNSYKFLNKQEYKLVKQLYNQYQQDKKYAKMNLIQCIDICESILQDFNKITKNEKYSNPNALVFGVKLKESFLYQYTLPINEMEMKFKNQNLEFAIQHQLNKNPGINREDAIGFVHFQKAIEINYSQIVSISLFTYFIIEIAVRNPQHAYLVLDYFINETSFIFNSEERDVMSIMYKYKINQLIVSNHNE